MKNLEELIAQIRFQLFQLASKNAHHDFEHICRHLSRARICSNILPATGPVSTGGDQGKDFETFRTYLSKSFNESAFVGLTSEEPIAFACTIQKTNLDKKIKSDINTIIDGDSEIAGVHYFLTQDLPVANRHKLQQWCKNEHSIYLEVYDGQAISELLSEYDVFWIAEKYLSIPNDLYPKQLKDNNWYSKLLDKWKLTESDELNYADFFEIKSAIRTATFNDNYKSDIIFWIAKLKIFLNQDRLISLKRKAIYEIVVASLRGLGNLECSFEDIDYYFESIEHLSSPYDLDEAEILINYCVGASRHNVFNYPKEKLVKCKEVLNTRIDENLKNEQSLTNICALYEIKGFTFISANPIGQDNIDLKEAIRFWNKVADLAKDCPLYPLERFIDRLTKIIGLLNNYLEGYYEDLEKLTVRLDSLLEKRFGSFAAAEKARDRAMQFRSNGAITRAIKQLHISKINWFAEETLKGSVISCIMIATWYNELHLIYAAKYYYLAASFIILESNKSELNKYFSDSLIRLAEIDYINGNWCSYIDFTELGLIGYNIFSDQSVKDDGTDELSRTIYHMSILLTLTKQIKPEIHETLSNKIERWGLKEYFDSVLPMAEKNFIMDDKEELWTDIINNFSALPLSDLGNSRKIIWSALGIDWEINFNNDYRTVPIAEQFVAIMQIILCDLSNLDLYLLKTKVSIHLSVDQNKKYDISPVPSNKFREWKVNFPYYEKLTKSNFDDIQTLCITSITEIFFEVSLKPYDNLMKLLEQSFKDGLSLKVFIAQPFEILFRKFISLESFNDIPRAKYEPPVSPNRFAFEPHPLLSWKHELAETYSVEKTKEFLINRYKYIPQSIKYTLPHLLLSSEFQETVSTLRLKGWKDWHILNSVAAITINYRMQRIPSVKNNPENMRKYMYEQMFKTELEDAEKAPQSYYSLKSIIQQHNNNMLSTLKALGLECRQMTPDFDAINEFLKYRFNYWEDDITHENLLE